MSPRFCETIERFRRMRFRPVRASEFEIPSSFGLRHSSWSEFLVPHEHLGTREFPTLSSAPVLTQHDDTRAGRHQRHDRVAFRIGCAIIIHLRRRQHKPTFPRWIRFCSLRRSVDSMISSDGVSFHDLASFSLVSTHFSWPEIPRNDPGNAPSPHAFAKTGILRQDTASSRCG